MNLSCDAAEHLNRVPEQRPAGELPLALECPTLAVLDVHLGLYPNQRFPIGKFQTFLTIFQGSKFYQFFQRITLEI